MAWIKNSNGISLFYNDLHKEHQMETGDDAMDLVGFPHEHGEAFLDVADAYYCIIMCRAPGKYTTSLIDKGYASKPFKIKAKSCNWGPMAGFVLDNPLFSKRVFSEGGFEKQLHDIEKAKQKGAGSIPLIISEPRRKELLKNKIIIKYEDEKHKNIGNPEEQNSYFFCKPTFYEWNTNKKFSNTQLFESLIFALKPIAIENQPNRKFWGVYVYVDEDTTRTTPVCALTNPAFEQVLIPPPFDSVPKYKRATTGDYDLFTIWKYEDTSQTGVIRGRPPALDRQLSDAAAASTTPPVSTTNKNVTMDATSSHAQMISGLEQDAGKMHDKYGNISPFVTLIKDKLNGEINKVGYEGGIMVHHGSEDSNPWADGTDLPVIVFIPPRLRGKILTAEKYSHNKIFALTTLNEFEDFIEATNAKVKPILNPEWVNQIIKDKHSTKAAGIAKKSA